MTAELKVSQYNPLLLYNNQLISPIASYNSEGAHHVFRQVMMCKQNKYFDSKPE